MIKVGLTGGIGSGKSTVAKAFSVLGVPVFNADLESRKFLDDPKVKASVIALLGNEIESAGQKLDRKRIAGIVFRDESKLRALNAILHPLVRERFAKWCGENGDAAYIIHEAAILFESGANKLVDKVISITCPEPVRIRRVMERDLVQEEQVRSRMKRQLSDEDRNRRSDFVIENDGEMILPQILRINEELLRLAKTQ